MFGSRTSVDSECQSRNPLRILIQNVIKHYKNCVKGSFCSYGAYTDFYTSLKTTLPPNEHLNKIIQKRISWGNTLIGRKRIFVLIFFILLHLRVASSSDSLYTCVGFLRTLLHSRVLVFNFHPFLHDSSKSGYNVSFRV